MTNKKDDPETTKALKLLASKMAQGIDVEDEIDALLNTKMFERDLEVEGAWERSHRPGEINVDEIDAKVCKHRARKAR